MILSILLLLRPSKSSDAAGPAPPSLNLGPGPIGGLNLQGVLKDGVLSNIVPLDEKKDVEEVRERIEKAQEIPEKATEYILEAFDVAPELIAALEPVLLEVIYDEERLDLLNMLRGLEQLAQVQELLFQQQRNEEQRLRAERELQLLRERIDDLENEELMILLIHQIH
jgi:hypothetical protein